MKTQSDSLSVKIATAALVGLGAAWGMKQVVRAKRKFDLANRVVLITGGSRGLGLALAREFGDRHARIAICARDQEELDTAANDLRERGIQVRTFVCDLRDPEQIRRMIELVEHDYGRIDVLVNNAGTIIVGPQKTMTIEDFREAMDVNFWAAVHTSMELIPKMKQRGFGRIVNIASVGGKMPVPHLAPYCASKFALVGFSGSMRAELAKEGILVTTINPNLMRTGSPRNALFKGNHQAEYAWFSISDDMPGLSMSAASAARRIVRATLHGDAEVTLGLPAKLAATLYGLSPDLVLELAGMTNRLLPEASGEDSQRRRGSESESSITRSPLRALGRRAEREYNQLQR